MPHGTAAAERQVQQTSAFRCNQNSRYDRQSRVPITWKDEPCGRIPLIFHRHIDLFNNRLRRIEPFAKRCKAVERVGRQPVRRR